MEVWDSTSGIPDQDGVFALIIGVSHCSSTRESLFQGVGKELLNDCQTQEEQCGIRPGREQWTSSSPLQGSWGGHGSLPIQSTCVL